MVKGSEDGSCASAHVCTACQDHSATFKKCKAELQRTHEGLSYIGVYIGVPLLREAIIQIKLAGLLVPLLALVWAL